MTEPGWSGQVRDLCESIAPRHGLEIVEIKLETQHRARVLSITVDKIDGLVGLDDLTAMSEETSRALDLEDPIPGRYTLEVSSAGIERPLVKAGDYRRFAGREIAVRCEAPLEGRRNLQGTIASSSEEGFVLKLEDEAVVEVPFSAVRRAHLVVDWEEELKGPREKSGPTVDRGRTA